MRATLGELELGFAREMTMALWICSACDRHVQPNATRCPFCDTTLGTTSALPQRMMMVAAFGLALAGCGDDGAPAEPTTSGEATTTGTATATDGATDTDSTGVGMTSTTASEPDAGGEDYAGPETDEWGEESADTTGTDTGTDTGSESTGTDTGSTSSDTEDDAGGQDYAGPETTI
jgi:hypothetical protein